MSSVARNRFLSALGVAQRLVTAEHAHVARRACSSIHHRNAVYRRSTMYPRLRAAVCNLYGLLGAYFLFRLFILTPLEKLAKVTASHIQS